MLDFNISSLPIELLLYIFAYCLPEDIIKLSLVSKLFKTIALDNLFWQERFVEYFPTRIEAKQNEKNKHWAKEFFVEYASRYGHADYSILRKKSYLFSDANKRRKELCDYVIKNNLLELKKVLHFKDLLDSPDVRISPLILAQQRRQTAFLADFYAIACNSISESILDGPTKISRALVRQKKLFIWRIKCHLPVDLLSIEDINEVICPKTNYTLLHIAAEANNLDVVKFLLQSDGINIDSKDRKGITPLYLACKREHVAVVEELLKYGADQDAFIDASESKEFSLPLYKWFYRTKPFAYYQLTGHGLLNKCTLLHLACLVENVKIVELLLQYKARFQSISLTCNHFFQKEENLEVLDSSLANCLTPLHIACYLGNLSIVKQLAHYGHSLDESYENSLSPLQVACLMGRYSIAEFLLDKGVNFDATIEHITPLCIATKRNHIKLVELLLNKGALIDDSPTSFFTPLFEVKNPIEIAKRLKSHHLVEILETALNVKMLGKKSLPHTNSHCTVS